MDEDNRVLLGLGLFSLVEVVGELQFGVDRA